MIVGESEIETMTNFFVSESRSAQFELAVFYFFSFFLIFVFFF